ncbi:MAG: lamin tail domain-containing protein [Polyangiaceae bacterium]
MLVLRSLQVLALALCGLTACLEPPQPARPDQPEVSLEPLSASGAEPVSRLIVRMPASVLDPADSWLFEGELSDYYLGRIQHRELPATLLERSVSRSAWLDQADGRTVVAPAAPLLAGAVYTLAAAGFGQLARVEVSLDEGPPFMRRVWPTLDAAAYGAAVFCGAQAVNGELWLEPGLSRAPITGFIGRLASGECCVRVALDAAALAGSWQVFPASSSGVAWDPAPLDIAATAPELVNLSECAFGELTLGPGCASVLDDRLVLRNREQPTLYVFERDAEPLLVPLAPGERFELRGLSPESPQSVTGSAVDLAGSEQPLRLDFETLPARPHVVLTEVLANALGAEPSSEWVELYNDGASAASLTGLRLSDGAGEIELPRAVLEPGQYALLVRDDFVENGLDVPPGPGTLLLRVPQLAKSGLSNSGEPLTLIDPSGAIGSRFPARASTHAGVSWARRSPSAADDAAASFAEHAAPGASPGAPNVLAP